MDFGLDLIVANLRLMQTPLTAHQLNRLEDEFRRTAYPNEVERLNLARVLGLTEPMVQVWFQNRRFSLRRRNLAANNAPAPLFAPHPQNETNEILQPPNALNQEINAPMVDVNESQRLRNLVMMLSDAYQPETSHSETNRAITAEVAIPKELLQAFHQENQEEMENNDDITEAEEKAFQNVLKKKMTCDICATGIKRFRCRRCFYSMCNDCKIQVVNANREETPCPNCGEPHKEFLTIVLPKL